MSGAAAVLMLTAACGGGSDTESESTDSSSSDETTEDASSTETATTYTVGDYSAEGSYQTPGGTQSVEVELSLEADGTITAVTVTPQADGGNSEQFQTKFAGGIADEVVGTKIDDLDVSKVSGSSLTSGGFNAAVDEIKAEAAA
ncbi:FMN-binding protein [Aeromicrobium sp. Leaf350]|uniref:FMN-binding protein n=1 Tax=Aeromicrobium sp. Leaf350 TaxID=2876565 RepID=UPI001E3DEA44|nr:FMN-binding protein [Aeromicrobium sp. Leaf350]